MNLDRHLQFISKGIFYGYWKEQNRSTIFINSGTTCEEVAKALNGKEALSIVTNSFDVAKAVNDSPGFRVILLGGELNSAFNFTYGSDVQEQLSNYRADLSIISVDGVSSDGSITTGHAEEAIIDCGAIPFERVL